MVLYDNKELTENEYALNLPLIIVDRAVTGDKDALLLLLEHYAPYITALSKVHVKVTNNITATVIDEDKRAHLQMHLIAVIRKWRKLL